MTFAAAGTTVVATSSDTSSVATRCSEGPEHELRSQRIVLESSSPPVLPRIRARARSSSCSATTERSGWRSAPTSPRSTSRRINAVRKMHLGDGAERAVLNETLKPPLQLDIISGSELKNVSKHRKRYRTREISLARGETTSAQRTSAPSGGRSFPDWPTTTARPTGPSVQAATSPTKRSTATSSAGGGNISG